MVEELVWDHLALVWQDFLDTLLVLVCLLLEDQFCGNVMIPGPVLGDYVQLLDSVLFGSQGTSILSSQSMQFALAFFAGMILVVHVPLWRQPGFWRILATSRDVCMVGVLGTLSRFAGFARDFCTWIVPGEGSCCGRRIFHFFLRSFL